MEQIDKEIRDIQNLWIELLSNGLDEDSKKGIETRKYLEKKLNNLYRLKNIETIFECDFQYQNH